MKRTPWVERTFDFNFPLGIFPGILERLRGTPARLEDIIQSFPAKILTLRIENHWSIQEHTGHLSDLEDLHNDRIDDFLAKGKILRPADMTNTKTNEANHNANSIENILNSFRKKRKHFVERLEELGEPTLTYSILHPRLQKPMRLVDMAYFVAEHDDHHLASVTELAKTFRDLNY